MTTVTLAPRRKTPLSKDIVVSPKPAILAFISSPPDLLPQVERIAPAGPPEEARSPSASNGWAWLLAVLLPVSAAAVYWIDSDAEAPEVDLAGVTFAPSFTFEAPWVPPSPPAVPSYRLARPSLSQLPIPPAGSFGVIDPPSGLVFTLGRKASLLNTGEYVYLSEITDKDGLLVFDADHDGRYGEDEKEIVGIGADLDGDGYSDGYIGPYDVLRRMALRAGVRNTDHLDREALGALAARYGLRVRRAGKLMSLGGAGIGAIDLLETSPLVLDLDGTGVKTLDTSVVYDLNGDGKPWRISGIGEGNGLLVFDADGDGRLGASGRELLGNLTDLNGDGKPEGFADGFEALKAMAARAGIKHAVLDKDDLALLEERFGLAIRRGGVEGKVLTLKEAGVASLALPTGKGVRARDFDGRGNDLERAEGAIFTRTDGTTGAYADLWFRDQTPSRASSTGVRQ